MSQEFHECPVRILKMDHKYLTNEIRHEFKVTVLFLNIVDRQEVIPIEEFSVQDQAFLKMNWREPAMIGSDYNIWISDKWLRDHHVPVGAWNK